MSQRYPFQTMTLGFGLSSLSPYCDPDTLYLHHGQYYAQKVRELNHLVSKHRFTNLSLEELLTQDINMPAVQLARLKGAAGAVYNHELYFDGIQSVMDTPPLNKLTGVLIGVYGSMNAKLAYIISQKSGEVASCLLGMDLGITLLDGRGGFSGDEKQVVLCAFKPSQIAAIKSAVTDIDPKAFVIVCEAHEVLGEGFGEYSPDSL